MTEKQQQTVDFVREYIKKNGYSPTFQEIGDHFNITVRAVVERLLPVKGEAIDWVPFKSRTMRIMEGQ